MWNISMQASRTFLRTSVLAICAVPMHGHTANTGAIAGTVLQATVDPRPIQLPIIDGTDIRFTRPSISEELLHTNVYRIVQDDQGFMWFATAYGLYRYDGYSFKVFAPDPQSPNSLSNVEINTVFKDRDGAIWVGCAQFLNKLDPATESFTRYPVPAVNEISQDSAGILWLATPTEGLFGLDPATGKIRHYPSDPHDLSSLSNNKVTYTKEDKEGRFWIATFACLEEFDRGTGKVKRHIPLPEARSGFAFYEDRFGILWIRHSSPFGLTAFDPKTNTLTHYAFPQWKPPSTGVTRVTAILEDRLGGLWMATHGAGLLKYDRDHRRFIRYCNDPNDRESLPQNNLDALFEDREGGIWVGLGRMGVVRFATKPLPFKRVPHAPGSRVEPFVGAIYEDRQGVVWVGTPEALNRIERTTGRFTSYRNGGPTTDVVALREDHSGNLWVGTYGHGLFRFDPRTGQFMTYRHDPADPHSVSDDVVLSLLFDDTGTLWAGTYSALSRFDATTQRFTMYNLRPPDMSPAYLKMVEDREGSLWLGTRVSGLQRFNPATGELTTYEHDTNRAGTLSDNRVNSLLFDRTGTMWVGTQNGLDKLDPKTGTFVVYTRRDGLPGNSVGCVLDDERGNLWISTNNGVARFDPQKKIVLTYSTADGLPGPNLTGWGACFKSPSGEMFFGGFSGATAFFPNQVVDTSYTPPIVLTDFRLSGNPVKVGSRSPLHRSISYVRGLVLSHQQNIFSLSFAALSYSNSATNRYRYKLEGLERDWNEVGSDRRQASYTTLPAGRYTFRVQGATSGGAWSNPGVAVSIEILPAWWNTWWFRASCMAAFLALLWTLHRHRLHQIAQEFNVRLEERVGERTRIARELHDTLLQSFHGSLFRFQAARNMLPRRSEEAMQALDGAILRTEEAIAEGRCAIPDLRSEPSAHSDLEHLLAAMGRELEGSQDANYNSANFNVTVEGKRQALSPILQDEIYRIARELLRNAFQHAQARQIEAEIRYDNAQLRLRIRDDGKGIDRKVLQEGSRTGHWGLPGIRERAKRIGGRLDFWSEAEAGTEAELTVPASVAYAKASNRDSGGFRLFRRKTGTHAN
jgi:ligand-binding sensor domain-containing protein/signal transduction histidine kinase